MNGNVAELKQEIKVLKERVADLERDHGRMSIFLEAFDKQEKDDVANTRKAMLSLVEALARVAHGSLHLTPEEQAKIKKLLGIG